MWTFISTNLGTSSAGENNSQPHARCRTKVHRKTLSVLGGTRCPSSATSLGTRLGQPVPAAAPRDGSSAAGGHRQHRTRRGGFPAGD